MSKPILEALFYGKIRPWERRVPHNPVRKEVECKIESEKRYFIEKMSLDDVQRFQRLENLYTQAHEHDEIDVFDYGFKLGVSLMCAAFADGELSNNSST